MTTSTKNSNTSKPIGKFKSGLIQVNVWKNELTDPNTGEIKPIFSIKMHKSYQKNGEWRQTNSINADEIPAVLDMLRDAHRYAKEAKHQSLMDRYRTGTQVNPVIPHDADIPQDTIAAEKTVQTSHQPQASGQ